jgi:hypothetical protein
MNKIFNICEDNRLKVQIGFDDTLEPQATFTLLLSDDEGNESSQRSVVKATSTIYSKCNSISLYITPIRKGVLLATVKTAHADLYVEVELNEGCFTIKKVDAPKLSFLNKLFNFIFT